MSVSRADRAELANYFTPFTVDALRRPTTLENLETADAFFASTNITAAEAETLTDGSDAQSLHKHEFYQRYSLLIS